MRTQGLSRRLRGFARSSLAVVLALTLMAAPTSLVGEPLPPPPELEEITGPPTLRQMPATQLTLGGLVARFERTTLASIQAAAKAGTIEHQGDAGASIYWLCYTVPHGKLLERIWIVAHGEMGGSDHAITEVSAEQLPSGSVTPDECPLFPPALRPLSLDRGVWLGLSRSQLIHSLGRPSGAHGDWLEFVYAGKVKLSTEGTDQGSKESTDWNETSLLAARLIGDKVVALYALKVTSN
jgi:hypothetical protein